MEKIQSVLLKTDQLESQTEPHAYANCRILSPSSFHWKQWNSMFLIWKMFDWYFDEKTQPVALEKILVVKKEASYIYITFGNLGPSKFRRKDRKRRYRYSIIFYKTFVDWDLDEEILTVASRETEGLIIRTNLTNIQFLATFASKVPLQRTRIIIWQSSDFLRAKKVDCYLDGWHAVSSFEERNVDFPEKITKTSTLPG